MLTPQDLQNLVIILNRTVYNGLDEAKVGVVLENKLKAEFEAATSPVVLAATSPQETPS